MIKKSIKFERATIDTVDGTTFIKENGDNKEEFFTNVLIEFEDNVIKVTGEKNLFTQIFNIDEEELCNQYDTNLLNKVKPEYIEDYNFIDGFFWNKKIISKKRIKLGYAELKNSPMSFKFITTNFFILFDKNKK